jgi:hypothetical protein
MFGSLLTKVQYSSLDLSESQQENAEDSDVRDERERINTTDVNTLINSDSIVIKQYSLYSHEYEIFSTSRIFPGQVVVLNFKTGVSTT